MQELKIFTPIGMLGYGFSESIFWSTLAEGVDAIILDSGSTDSGPSKLALGKPTVSRKAYERDLALLVAGVHYLKKPLLIGSSGGDGSNSGVDLLLEIIRDTISREGYRDMKVLHIYSEIDKDVVRAKHKAGLISPCGKAVPSLNAGDIENATKIVAQMGMEPWLQAMNDNPDFDIIVGGRTYDPSPYAAFCLFKGLSNLGTAYHMGKIMECGALCSTPKSKSALAIVRNDSFDIRPLEPESRCTVISVAAHTLYEKTRPDILLGPGGALHLQTATYEELPDTRTVRVAGAVFVPEDHYTLKLEAARISGFHSMCFGGIRDPILISQIDSFLSRCKQLLAQNIPYAFELDFRVYGRDAVMGPLEPCREAAHEVCVRAHALASTQEEATHVVHMARVYLMHAPYPNQRATAGNFAMPSAPLDIPLGQISEFCIYHLMVVQNPTEYFPVYQQVIHGPNTASALEQAMKSNADVNGRPAGTELQVRVTSNGLAHEGGDRPHDLPNGISRPPQPRSSSPPSVLNKEPPPGHVFLADLATIIRSKNAGPYELTFDIMFPDAKTRDMVKENGILNEAVVAQIYKIDKEDVIASLWWDQALAFKATIKRPRVGGGFWETDSHGSQQHLPFMELLVPVESNTKAT